MHTKKRVDITYKKVEFIPEFKEFEDNVIYISDEYGISLHKCICGCGEKVAMPLGAGEWNYKIDSSDNISMHPSVGNYQIPCKSHYIFYKGGANFV
jgi:hypothetical protein